MDLSNWINLGLLGITAVGVLVAIMQAKAAGKASDDAAEHEKKALEAALRAATAATASAEAQARVADALEVRAQLAISEAERYEDPWSVRKEFAKSGHKWTFTLGGSEPAHEVEWSYDAEAAYVFRPTTELPKEMRPGDAVQFVWLRTMGSASSVSMEVSWHRPNESERRTSRATLLP